MNHPQSAPLDVAVIGSGISGLAAAWLLSQKHRVTIYEAAERPGGHSCTVDAALGSGGRQPIDMGFIVYNEVTYPNLSALFAHLGVGTVASDMSFAVSLGDFEYSGTGLSGLFARRRNLVDPAFWRMFADIVRFYRAAPGEIASLDDAGMSLGRYLAERNYSHAFIERHILPQAAAIWSTPAGEVADYPVAAFLRFCDNHGLLRFTKRPQWRTVEGGSRMYVQRLLAAPGLRLRLDCGVERVRREGGPVELQLLNGTSVRHDRVLIAAHADSALAILESPTARERAVLGSFRYTPNLAVLHTDPGLMPRRRAVWSSWNYVAGDNGRLCVSYWMNRLQTLATQENFFVTLNPPRPPRASSIITSEVFDHPVFDAGAISAQKRLWSLQAEGNVWFAGAYFGAGFHEDGLQAGLAAAEDLGGVRRPWQVENESGRIHVHSRPPQVAL